MRHGRRAASCGPNRSCPSCLGVLVAVLSLLAGCRSTDVYQSAGAQSPAPVARGQKPEKPVIKPVSNESVELPAPPLGSLAVRVVARVNDMPILEEEVRGTSAQYELQAVSLPEPVRSEKIREIRTAALQRIIERELVLSDLHEKVGKTRPLYLDKLREVAHKEFNRHLNKIRKNIEEKTGKPIESDNQLREILESQGVSFEGYQRQFEREFMSVEYLRARIFPTVRASVGHQEIVDYYEAHGQEFETVDQVHWMHIFIDASRYDSREAARKLAQSLARQAYNGADFRELIKNFDNGFSSQLGEDNKVCRRGEVMPPELEPHLFKMRDGQIGPIIEARHGFHVFKLVKREYAGRKPLTQEIQSEIRKKLQNDSANLETRRFINDLKERAAIEILDNDLVPPEKPKEESR